MCPALKTCEHLDWCPNHPASAATPARSSVSKYPLVIITIVVVILAAAVIIPERSQENVAVWAFSVDESGTRHFVTRLPAQENAAGGLTFKVPGADTRPLPAGNYWLVIERPAEDGSYRFALGENYVVSYPTDSPDEGMNLFSVTGPGSLAGEDAYEALIAAYNGGMHTTGSTTPDLTGMDVTEQGYIVER
jgi:hypothetical protein